MWKIVAVLVLAAGSFAQDVKPSLTVRPEAQPGPGRGGLVGRALSHQRFYHTESSGLSIKDTKTWYTKKDLEKLEAKGVKITVKDMDGVKVVLTNQ